MATGTNEAVGHALTLATKAVSLAEKASWADQTAAKTAAQQGAPYTSTNPAAALTEANKILSSVRVQQAHMSDGFSLGGASAAKTEPAWTTKEAALRGLEATKDYVEGSNVGQLGFDKFVDPATGRSATLHEGFNNYVNTGNERGALDDAMNKQYAAIESGLADGTMTPRQAQERCELVRRVADSIPSPYSPEPAPRFVAGVAQPARDSEEGSRATASGLRQEILYNQAYLGAAILNGVIKAPDTYSGSDKDFGFDLMARGNALLPGATISESDREARLWGTDLNFDPSAPTSGARGLMHEFSAAIDRKNGVTREPFGWQGTRNAGSSPASSSSVSAAPVHTQQATESLDLSPTLVDMLKKFRDRLKLLTPMPTELIRNVDQLIAQG